MNIANKNNGIPLVGFGHLEQAGVEMEMDVLTQLNVDKTLYEERIEREQAAHHSDPFKDGDIDQQKCNEGLVIDKKIMLCNSVNIRFSPKRTFTDSKFRFYKVRFRPRLCEKSLVIAKCDVF